MLFPRGDKIWSRGWNRSPIAIALLCCTVTTGYAFPVAAQAPLPNNLPPSNLPPLAPGVSQPSFSNPNTPPGGFAPPSTFSPPTNFSTPVSRPNLPDFINPLDNLPQTSSRNIGAGDDYILGGGDTVFIDVFQVPQYSGNYQIPIDGSIFMPLIGRVPLQGLSLGAATERISNAYAQFLRRPLINIRLINTRPVNISIGGEVNRPGSYTVVLTPGVNAGPGLIAGVQYPTVLQTIQQAGGVNLTADLSNVQLRRSSNPGLIYTVNIRQILQTGDRSQDPTLRDGDSIFIPTGNNQTLLEALQITNLGIGTDIRQPRNIAVVGEVNRPGFYTLVGAADNNVAVLGGFPTVSGAIQQAGGIKPFADVRNIQVRRYTALGQERSFTISLWDLLQGGDITQDTVLQNGDTIIVPTATALAPGEATALAEARFAPTTIKVSIVGEVVRPGAVDVPPNTPLNQAILTAGGFKDDRANQTVQLIRLNPDGTVSRQDFAADFAQGINTQNNPILQNQDIIVVSRNTSANILDVLASFLNPFAGLREVLTIFR
ncbi:MAG: hypothetical protein HC916_18170 [Coleofasciculaceae cyanobacterium SM2_1_6]|nr:hypothetical protein [Coleofasciculaceae cyanobacterium SM2_1_6]